jgi:hypothetical protein
MKKLIFLILIIFTSCDNREVIKTGDVVEKEHRFRSHNTPETYYLIRKVEYTDGTKGLKKFEVSMEEYYNTSIPYNVETK